jgi:hypothetical protein
MASKLVERIQRQAGTPNLVEILAEQLAPSDLSSLMLEVYSRSSRRISAGRLLQQYERNRFVAPSTVDPRLLVEFDRLAWRLLPAGFVPLELAPLCPLGTNSVVASVSQNKVVSAGRNTEVVADSTNVLALECAVRRKRLLRGAGAREPVLLAASHRLTRAQAFKGAGFSAHFRILSLCAAGRDEGSFEFEARRLLEQISFYLSLLAQLRSLGSTFSQPRIAITDLTESRAGILEERILAPLSGRHPEAKIHFDPDRTSGRGYYEGVCFKLFAMDSSGAEIELGDGGSTSWTRSLLSDAKERLIISAIGTERLCAR